MSGTWQGLQGTAASDALIQLLLAHKSGSTTNITPTPAGAGLAALLPSTSQLPPELPLEFEGALTAEAMPLTFSAGGGGRAPHDLGMAGERVPPLHARR